MSLMADFVAEVGDFGCAAGARNPATSSDYPLLGGAASIRRWIEISDYARQAADTGGGRATSWAQWGVASRLQWDVTKSFYVGAEVMYNKMTSAHSATGFVPSNVVLTGSACGAGNCVVADQDNWIFTIRMQKSFLP